MFWNYFIWFYKCPFCKAYPIFEIHESRDIYDYFWNTLSIKCPTKWCLLHFIYNNNKVELHNFKSITTLWNDRRLYNKNGVLIDI
jgi:hypothetical protein